MNGPKDSFQENPFPYEDEEWEGWEDEEEEPDFDSLLFCEGVE